MQTRSVKKTETWYDRNWSAIRFHDSQLVSGRKTSQIKQISQVSRRWKWFCNGGRILRSFAGFWNLRTFRWILYYASCQSIIYYYIHVLCNELFYYQWRREPLPASEVYKAHFFKLLWTRVWSEMVDYLNSCNTANPYMLAIRHNGS